MQILTAECLSNLNEKLWGITNTIPTFLHVCTHVHMYVHMYVHMHQITRSVVVEQTSTREYWW